MGSGHEHDHDHVREHGEDHDHEMVEVTLELEAEHLAPLDALAAELTRTLGQPWDRGAVVRLALSQFFSRRGIIT